MACVHLRELYQLCEKNQIRIGGSDLIRIVCHQCEKEETCPSTMLDDVKEEAIDNTTADQRQAQE